MYEIFIILIIIVIISISLNIYFLYIKYFKKANDNKTTEAIPSSSEEEFLNSTKLIQIIDISDSKYKIDDASTKEILIENLEIKKFEFDGILFALKLETNQDVEHKIIITINGKIPIMLLENSYNKSYIYLNGLKIKTDDKINMIIPKKNPQKHHKLICYVHELTT